MNDETSQKWVYATNPDIDDDEASVALQRNNPEELRLAVVGISLYGTVALFARLQPRTLGQLV